MALLFKGDIDRGGSWERALAARAPDIELRSWPELGDPAEIDYALVWEPPAGLLASLPNLKIIFSIGAGIDHLRSDPKLPPEVPIIRMVEPGLTNGMTEFVVMSVLYHHRFMLDYLAQQRAREWREISQIGPAARRIGIMGLGVLGQDAAARLLDFGFPVAGWSRSAKEVPGVTGFAGQEGLLPFLQQSDILVCLLPSTPETQGLLNAETLAALPRGAAVINAGRGSLIVLDDLLAALDSGQIGGATLDVFPEEPLPAASPLWDHPRIVLTPHIASMTIPESAAAAVIAQIRRFEAGQPLEHVVDFKRGY